MRDFTITSYLSLLTALQNAGYRFCSYAQFNEQSFSTDDKVVVLRHDVDARPLNSLLFAQLQKERGIIGTYYFRTVKESYDTSVIKAIAGMGHEIGYHYETMDTAGGNVDEAYRQFENYLALFRNLAPITTICMHGSPLSKYDNREIWKKYSYKNLGLIAEPYFDLDFDHVFYLTDTGRRWDGDKVSVRDKAMHPISNPLFTKLRFSSTSDIVSALVANKLPNKIMLTFHPQRWNNAMLPWCKELILQNLKNLVKRFIVR